MTPSAVRICLVTLSVTSSQALAQRVSLLDFSGRGGAPVRTQLANRLCGKVECVAATKVTVGGRPNLKKARQEHLDSLVSGTIITKASKSVLELVVLAPVSGATSTWTFPVARNGLLSASSLQAAVDSLDTRRTARVLQAAVPAAEKKQPEAAARSARAGEPTGPTERTPSDVEPAAPEAAAATPSAEPSAPVVARGPRPLFLVVEVGSDVLNRQLRYYNVARSGPDVPPLYPYDLPVFSLPTVRFEIYPLARSRDGDDPVTALGVDGSFGMNPLLVSQTKTSSEVYPTTALKGEAALRGRLVVSRAFPVVVSPFVGFRIQSFTVRTPSADVPKLMPSFSYVSLKAGLSIEVPLALRLLFLTARVSALPVFSPGEIISSEYFSRGSALGFEGSAGLRVEITAIFRVQASFEISQYQSTFTPKSGDRYIAASGDSAVTAVDRYLGGNISVSLAL